MGWYVALFWEDYRYFCCSSQNNLMKGEIFLWSVSKIIDLKSLLKSALTGKDVFDISSWSCPSFILSSFCFSFDKFELLILGILRRFVKLGHLSLLVLNFIFFKSFFLVDKVFLSNVFEFLQLSFGLSIKSTHEIEWSKMTWWSGTEEFWKKIKSFWYWMTNVFFACWLLIPEQIL